MCKAVFRAVVLWTGEATIGPLPLMTHVIVTHYSIKVAVPALCDVGMRNCREIPEKLPSAEMDILAVIVCGLALLSLINFGPNKKRRIFTPLTYLAGITNVLLMVFGSILYAIVTAGIGQDNESVTTPILILSLVASFYLAFEEAWLDAIHESLIAAEKKNRVPPPPGRTE